MPSDQSVDVAVLTVIPVELQAAAKALGIDLRSHDHHSGTIYYTGSVYCSLCDRNLRVVLTCIGQASQASASAAASRLIPLYAPALVVLLGIAAGWRGKIRIGDVVVPREIVDLSIKLETVEGSRPRPQIKPLSTPVRNMLPGFMLDEPAYHSQCRELFGPAIIPPLGKEDEFVKNVTLAPKVVDNLIGSADALLRDPDAFVKMSATHDQIRAAEMEAGGFVKACDDFHPSQPWLVVRGISDFGDDFKDDQFHRLAATAAATWLRCFLTDGFDILNIRPSEGHVTSTAALPNDMGSSGTATVQIANNQASASPAPLSPLVIEAVNAQIEQLAGPLNADREKDFERVRETWHARHDTGVLNDIRILRQRPEMRFADSKLRAKLCRFEAGLVLSVEKNIPKAKALASEAEAMDPSENPEFLGTLITYHEHGKEAALQHLVAPRTLEGWNLRTALLIESGNTERALEESAHPPSGVTPDAESHRLLAFALLKSGQFSGAQIEIKRALKLRPQWFLIRYMGALIDYFESFSAPLFAHARKDWPVPTDPALIKRDRATLESLRRAGQVFSELLSTQNLESDLRQILEGWRLACLSNDAERNAEAQAYCNELLEREPTHPSALSWAIARGFTSDLDRGTNALLAEFLTDGK